MRLQTAQPALIGALLALIGAVPALAGEGMAYVSNQKGNVTVIDLASLEPVSEIDPGGGPPRGIGVTADGKLLVIATQESGDDAIIDRASGQVVKRVPIGENPEFVRVRGDQAFVSFEAAAGDVHSGRERPLDVAPSTARENLPFLCAAGIGENARRVDRGGAQRSFDYHRVIRLEAQRRIACVERDPFGADAAGLACDNFNWVGRREPVADAIVKRVGPTEL